MEEKMEEEFTTVDELASENQVSDMTAEGSNDADLLNQIAQEESKLNGEQAEVAPEQDKAAEPKKEQVTEPEQPQEGQVAEEESAVGAENTGEKTEVVQQPISDNVQELMSKKGFKSVDEIAKSYINLEKQFSSRGKPDQGQQPTQPAQPQAGLSTDEMNQAFLQDLAKNPIGTLKQFYSYVSEKESEPLKEQLRALNFRNELTRLGSSPATASFNEKSVQDEMSKIVTENPNKFLVNGKFNPEDLEPLYYMALGRRSVGMAQSKPAPRKVNKPPVVEGASKPQQAKGFDVNTASPEEIEREIHRQMKLI